MSEDTTNPQHDPVEDETMNDHAHDQPQIDPSASDAQSSPPDTTDKTAEYLAGWKRALADYENLQKRMSDMRDDDRRRVRSSLAEDLLPVVDNFGYVTKHIPDTTNCPDEFKKQFDVWVQGIGHIERQFLDVLKTLGIEPIESLGKPFDPNLHESGGVKHIDGTPEGEIVEELVKGWRIGEIVLRPAKVILSE